MDLKMFPSEISGAVPAIILPMNRREARVYFKKPASGRIGREAGSDFFLINCPLILFC
jgi:hypothetical protein